MKILLTGGGTSAGHVTPSLAVAHELKKIDPNVITMYVAQKGDSLAELPRQHLDIDQVYEVQAGKFRRYHGVGAKQFLDLETVAKNFRDLWRFGIGFVQSYFLLRKLRPDCILMKGGYVGAPVGFAAALLRIPYITHDSDALPGLANRMVARWAAIHAVALPKETYDYPPEKTVMVGVPSRSEFVHITPKLQKEYRKQLELEKFGKMLFVTGGGQGSQRLNEAVVKAVPELLRKYKGLVVVHAAGGNQAEAVVEAYKKVLDDEGQGRVAVQGFIPDIHLYSGAADVIITRAGATAMAEFAVQGKALVIVPNPYLTGGHQTKNAQLLADRRAALCITEQELAESPVILELAVTELFANANMQRGLAEAISKIGRPDAARELAKLLLDEAMKRKT
jgi:UDP-N-acetylglucosamine--N-acetylmuramyl-(pentapeptide) pyrophosphoryl-undecaprenol N-acetylglucosamine transferase